MDCLIIGKGLMCLLCKYIAVEQLHRTRGRVTLQGFFARVGVFIASLVGVCYIVWL